MLTSLSRRLHYCCIDIIIKFNNVTNFWAIVSYNDVMLLLLGVPGHDERDRDFADSAGMGSAVCVLNEDESILINSKEVGFGLCCILNCMLL